MNFRRLWIDRFKNLRNCEVTFEERYLYSAVIGGSGSGKSNLVEAILHILLDTYLNKPPPFEFTLESEAQGRPFTLSGVGGWPTTDDYHSLKVVNNSISTTS